MRKVVLTLVAAAAFTAALAGTASANVLDIKAGAVAVDPCPEGYKGVVIDGGSEDYKVCYDI